ncbi:MAG: rod shape-determining protein MreD [Bacillati bacterium ANGP1]|uniref:Rod shape-determining protein MreD n=1 Tax=Candidatus Segetimicrobium genomatis TaxID=2569760 RepID=A0A537J313_9BACT|nr:MAG: rod shape-determining protein MreD [Terrabacteria group bacterium ANGP1]
MIRYAVYLLLVTALLALQTTWLAGAGIGGAVPDPLIILIMIVGLFHGPEEGAVFGAGAGLLEDVVTGAPLGLAMLADLCVGFAAGLGVRIIYMENVWLPLLGAAALTGLRVIVWVGAAHLVGLLQPPLLEVLRVALLGACYNGLVAFPLYHGLRSLDRALVRFREESR